MSARRAVGALIAVVAFMVAGGAVPAAADQQASIVDFSFQPADITVDHLGALVTWTNNGNAQHTVDFNIPGGRSSTLNKGDKFVLNANKPGKFPYHCDIHPNMTGTLTVNGGPAPAPATTVAPGTATTAAPATTAVPAPTTTLGTLPPLPTTTTTSPAEVVQETTSAPPLRAAGKEKKSKSRAPWIGGAVVALGLSGFGTLLFRRRLY